MNDQAKILIVDDEEGILKLLEITLRKEHFTHITTATTKAEALVHIANTTFDIILLDVMLPDGDGFSLCSAIRQQSTAPILFVSARTSDFDKLTGLSMGGDDYITKPFNPLEVVARIRAILRRQREYGQPNHATTTFEYATFSFNPEQALLIVNGEPVHATAKELELLRFFCEHPNYVFTTDQIYERVWGEDMYGEEKTVTIHIAKIRKKIGDDTKNPKVLVNLRGIGYKFVPPLGDSI